MHRQERLRAAARKQDARLQGAFDFGSEAEPWRPRLPERLFFALVLDPADRDRFADCQRRCWERCGAAGKTLDPARFHVSLQHVRDDRILRPRYVYGAQLAAAKVRRPRFEVGFRAAGSFRGRPETRGRPAKHPFVLLADAGPVCELSALIGAAMRECGLRAADGFVPHMTFGYGPGLVPRQPVESIGFVPKEFVLIHSLRGLGIHRFLDRWPLLG